MPAKSSKRLTPRELADVAVAALEDVKANDVVCLPVGHLSSMMDYMVIASGRSDRHVRSLADALLERCKTSRIRVIGHEGQEAGEWILVDLADVIVHVMLPKTREFYELEKLWGISIPGGNADRGRVGVG
jgi:ribosome-associated protein